MIGRYGHDCRHYRLLAERGNASSPTIEEMAESARVRSIDITGAIKNLVGLALIAVKPGSGRHRNRYLLALPKRLVASMAVAAVDDEDVPPF
jgi:DNA-binding MarR family transcriptional regulator